MFRACNKKNDTDSTDCAHFASPYIAPFLCPASPLTYGLFVPKVVAAGIAKTGPATYGDPIPNLDAEKKPRPPACSYVGLLDETEAQERCSADKKCVGYYKEIPDWATAGQDLLQNFMAVFGKVPIAKKAPSDGMYRLSVALPGECAVDWKAVDNTGPVCEKLLGKRPPGKSWIESDAAKPGTFCLPSPTLNHGDGYYSEDNFYAIHDVTTQNGAKCPLGWTAIESGQCFPPCLEGQKRDYGHSGAWCYADEVTSCPPGYERYRRAMKGSPRSWFVDGMDGTGYHRSSFLGQTTPTAWDYCVPSPKEINAVISQNK
jgi:hypothetical protein